MPQDGLKIKGRWWVRLYGDNGNLKQEIKGNNVVCTNGKEFLASFLNSAVAAASTFTCKYIGIGSDTTPENAADTALNTELARQTGTVSYISGQIYQVTATFPSATGTGAITEYGLFSSNTAGTMFTRDTEAVINKGANDELVVTHQITFS